MADQDAEVLSTLGDQLAELQVEFNALKQGLMDKRWEEVAQNFEQLSANLIHLDGRVDALEAKLERPVKPDIV